MRRALRRIPVFSIISLLLLAGVIVLWVRSRRHADIVGYYTPAGHLQGFSNDRAGLIVFFSDIPFGPEMGLSADAMSAPAEEFLPIHDLLFDPSNIKWHHIGFQFASAPIGSWGWKFSAWIVPYWALIIPLSILPLVRLRRFLILRRRIKRGQCLSCGYDLRHSEARCPECGRPIGAGTGAPDEEPKEGHSGRLMGILPWLVALGMASAATVPFLRGRHALAAAIGPAEPVYLGRPIEQMGPSSADIQHWIAAGQIRVGAITDAPRVMRSYPVADLLAPSRSGNVRTDVSSTIEIPGPGEEVPVCRFVPLRTAFEDAVAGSILCQQWCRNFGRIGGEWCHGGRLWVWQTQQGHAAVRTLLAALRSPVEDAAGPATAPAVDPQGSLNQSIPELNLESTTLERALDTLRNQTRCNIVVYWQDLEEIGIHRDTAIHLHLWKVTLDRALGAILTLAGGEYPGMRLDKDGIIIVSSPERLRNDATSVRVYNVRDLIADYCAAHPEPVETLAANDAKATIHSAAAGEAAQLIQQIVEDSADPDSWKDNGGSVGTIREFNGLLIVSQTPSGHRAISEFLRKLRTGEKPMTRPARP